MRLTPTGLCYTSQVHTLHFETIVSKCNLLSSVCGVLHALELPVCQNFLLLYLSLPDPPLALICTPHALCTQKKPLPVQVPRSSPGTLKRSDGGQRNRQPRVLDRKIRNFISCLETIQLMVFVFFVVFFY